MWSRILSFLPQLTRRDALPLGIILAIVVPVIMLVRAWQQRRQKRALHDLMSVIRQDSDLQKQRIRDVMRRAEERQERERLEAELNESDKKAEQEQKDALREMVKDDASLSAALNAAGIALDDKNPGDSANSDRTDDSAQ